MGKFVSIVKGLKRKSRLIALCFAVWIVLFGFGLTSSFAATDIILQWNAPTTNIDGTPLTDLAGFKIYLHKGDVYSPITDISASTLSTTISLEAGENCFVATAYDTSGNESDYSNQVCKDTLAPATFILTIKTE